MSLFSLLVVFFSILGFFACIVWLIVNIFKKRKKRFPIVGIICAIVLTIVFSVIWSETPEGKQSALEYKAEEIKSNELKAEKAASEKAEADKAASEKAEADKAASVKAEADKAASEKAEADKAASEKAEADKIASENKNNKALNESEYKNACIALNYEDIMRNPDNYNNISCVLSGSVNQIVEGFFGSYTFYIVDNNGNKWGCKYSYKDGESHLLEGDQVTVYGKCNGTAITRTIFGKQVTLPYIVLDYIR